MGEAQWWFEQMHRAANIASGMANKNATDGATNLGPGELCTVGR